MRKSMSYRPSTYNAAKGRCVHIIGKTAIAGPKVCKKAKANPKSSNPLLAVEIIEHLGKAVLFEDGIVFDKMGICRTFFWEKDGVLTHKCFPTKTRTKLINNKYFGQMNQKLFNGSRKEVEIFILKKRITHMTYSELRSVLADCRIAGYGTIDKSNRDILLGLIGTNEHPDNSRCTKSLKTHQVFDF